MASMEKLMKALEALKVVQPMYTAEDTISQKRKDGNTRVKDRILHCCTVADAICSSSVRSSSEFPKVLGLAMDTFLLCCDDDNSDVRLMADECLNRTIKTLLDSHLGRILVELFKEIKKNGSARSLRAALNRFGDICHLMRPQKCRPYTVNLVPALAKICHRKDEESVQETLSVAMTKLMPVLGQFTNDKEIKILLKAFLQNLASNSAIVRRAAATSLTYICQYSRRPSSFFSRILLALFDVILPVQEEHTVYLILGVLLCLRHIVPHFSEVMFSSNSKGNTSIIQNDEESIITKEQLLKIYELTLYFTKHSNNNVITAALETLHQLLKTAPKVLQQTLVSPVGITESLIFNTPTLNHAISESQFSMISSLGSLDESALEDDEDIFMLEKQLEDNYGEDDVRSNCEQIGDGSISLDGDSEDLSEYSSPKLKVNIGGGDADFHSQIKGLNFSSSSKKSIFKTGMSEEILFDTDDELWDHSSSPSPGATTKIEFKLGIIGTYTDSDIPLNYCTRLLCSSFLLSGTSQLCISDANVRISVKSLALGCLSSVFSLYPSGFFLPLHLKTCNKSDPPTDVQQIWDVILFASHVDPHIRGQASVMIGHFLSSALREAGGHWSKWVSNHVDTGAPTLTHLLSKLNCIIQDDSSVASKLGLVGVKQCLNAILNSSDALESLGILKALLEVKSNSYWLFKVELTELITCIPFETVHYLENKHMFICSPSNDNSYQDKVLKDILIPLLGDEDSRVRQASAVAFTKLVSKLFFPMDHLNKDPVIAISRKTVDAYLDMSDKSALHSALPLVHSLVKPFSLHDSMLFNPLFDASLSRVINLLLHTLKLCTNKYLIYGCCHTLSLLSEAFLVTVFPETWIGVISNFQMVNIYQDAFELSSCQTEGDAINNAILSIDLISHLISLVTNTTLCLDLVAHQNVLQLAGNLLCGLWYRYFSVNHSKNHSHLQEMKSDTYICSVSGRLFSHLMRLLNIFAHVLEEQCPLSVSSRSLPSLPNANSLSPIKRKNKPKDDLTANSSIIKGSPGRVVGKHSFILLI